MKRQLILIRHAKAAIEPEGSDFDRPLAPRGRQDTPHLARWLLAQGYRAGMLHYSSAQRTSQTMALLQQEGWGADVPAQAHESLYLATAGDLLDYIHHLPNEQPAATIIGHNPGLHQLASLLAAADNSLHYREMELSFPTCACAVLSCDAPSWQDMAPASAGLAGYWCPRLGRQ